MKLSTEKKIEFVVDKQMVAIQKYKKVELRELLQDVLTDYIRELDDYTIQEMYDECFFGKGV